MGAKTNYLRGSFGNPWLIQSFFVAKSSELYEKYKSDSNARNDIDKLTQIGTGGGNVTKDLPGAISLAGKFGLRAEEVPALNKITDYWAGKTLEEVGERISSTVPGFDVKNKSRCARPRRAPIPPTPFPSAARWCPTTTRSSTASTA